MASELLAVETIEETEIDPTQPGVSWAAIAAGAVAAAALSLLLVAFGAGLGLSAVSPWSDSGVSASTFSIGTGIYLCIVAVMSSAIGGYLAGRMRTKISGLHTNEVFFRDTAHGFLAWAFATLNQLLLQLREARQINVIKAEQKISSSASDASSQNSIDR